MGLDQNARLALENFIDQVLKDPEQYEALIKIVLRSQGIEPTLDSCLSLVAGYSLGGVISFYAVTLKREMNDDEINNYVQLMKRRAWEIRQAFIETRIKE